jgi:membrane protein involved in colicin uptake
MIRLSKRVRWLSHLAQFLPEPNEAIVDMDAPSTAGGSAPSSESTTRPPVRRDAPFSTKVTHAQSANAPRPPNAAPGVKVPARLSGKATSSSGASGRGGGGGGGGGIGGGLSSLMRRKQPPSRTKSELNMGLDFADIESGEVLYDPNRPPTEDGDDLSGRDRGMSVLPFRQGAEPASSYAAPVAVDEGASDTRDAAADSAPLSPRVNGSSNGSGASLQSKPFACDICGARYAVESDVQFHKQKRHRAEAELAAAERAALERKQQAEQRRLQEEKKRAYEKKLEDAKAKYEAERQARARQQREADEATERARAVAAKAEASEREEARRRVAEAEAAANAQRARIAEENRLAEARYEAEQRAQQEALQLVKSGRGEDALSAVMSLLDDGADDGPSVRTAGNSSAELIARVASPAPPSVSHMVSALSTEDLSSMTSSRSAAQLAKERAAQARAALEAAAHETRRLELEAQRLEQEEAERLRAEAERQRAEAKARADAEAKARADAEARARAEAKARAEAAREAQLANIRQRARVLLDDCGGDKDLLAIVVDETKAAMLRQKQLQGGGN